MESELDSWTECRVEDIAAPTKHSMATGPFGSAISSKFFRDEGVPIIRGRNLSAEITEKIVDERWVYVTPEKASEHQRSLVRDGDLVFTCWGTIEQVGLIDTSAPYAEFILSNKQMKLTPDPTKATSLFLYYFFSNPIIQERILRNDIGSTIPGFNLGQLKAFKIRLPPLAEQKAIAHILGTLDDKIELNRRMNETLESMARALFKSWFVDFDPVIDNALAAGNPIPDALSARAKTRRALGPWRKPLPKNIQELFPNSFVFTDEMGWIPGGWEVETLGAEFSVTMGQSPPGDTYNEDGVGTPFYQGRRDFGFRFPTNRVYCTAPKRMAEEDDTLVSVRAPVGDVNMASEECCIGRGVAAVRHGSGSRSFTYYSMQQLSEHFKVYEGEGTVFGSISKKDFNALPQISYASAIVAEFEKYGDELDDRIEINSKVIDSLAKLRDTLLPKLLSGELRIPDAEKLVADSL